MANPTFLKQLLAGATLSLLVGCVAEPAGDDAQVPAISSSSVPSPSISSSSAPSVTPPAVSSSSSSNATGEALRDGYIFAANEKDTVAIGGVMNVAYGAQDQFVYLLNQTSDIVCNNAAFGGDPIPRVRKACYTQVVSAPEQGGSDNAPVSQSPADLFAAEGCTACHANGALLNNLALYVENGTMANKIATSMPPTNIGACTGECADTLAQYIEDTFYVPVAAGGIEKANVPVQSYLRKAKTLINGAALTADELRTVKNNPEALPGLIREWQQNPGYRQKMRWFLEENIQFSRGVGPEEYVGQLRGNNKANPPTKFVNPLIYKNGQESAIKTIMELIVDKNEPFTNIATQREWMMTPALMSLLLAFDYPNESSKLDFKIGVNLSAAEKRYSMAKKIETRRFYFPPPPGLSGFKDQGGNIQTVMNRKEVAFVWGALNQYSNQTRDASAKLFKDSDYTTWKKVKIVKANSNNKPIPFWDLPALRRTNTLYLNTERVGFFTHPNFFGRWETNDDNQFRVTINQALIAALNQSFAPDDLSITLDESAISPEHATPGTDCYACHRLLDPMRNYFRNRFDDTHGKPRTDAEKRAVNETSSFSFNGASESGGSLLDLGRALANHPQFAPGWVQKLCSYANSQACVEGDEDFKDVAQAFEDSGFNFNELIVAFFSSNLVKKDIEERSAKVKPAFASITRQQHTCQLLERRLTEYAGRKIEPCRTGSSATKLLASNIPADDWIRGALQPATPTRPDMFSYTIMENLCKSVAEKYFDGPAFPNDRIDKFLDDYLLPAVLGVPTGDSRRGAIRAALKDHNTKLVQKGGITAKQRLISVFTLGCSSPLLSAVDF